MKIPFLFTLPFTHNFKRRLFFRFYHPLNKKYEPLFDCVALKYAKGKKLKLVPTDFMHGLIAFTGVYEEALTKSIIEKTPKGGVFVDVGANAGYFCVVLHAHNPTGKVYAFEASPRNWTLLESNVSDNIK